MRLYIDAQQAVSHAYQILAREESLAGTLADNGPGSDYTAQEWVVHATYVIKGLIFATEGPYLRAIQAQYAHQGRRQALDLLAPRINGKHRGYTKHALARWAFGSRIPHDTDRWTGVTHRGPRTLQRWHKEVWDQADHFQRLGFEMATSHFRDTGICESREVA